MTLIDTSGWIEFFRVKGYPGIKSRVADLIASGTAAYTCPVHYELFLGARPQEVRDIQQGLAFARRFCVTQAHWDSSAGIGASLRLKGFSFPALDLLIAIVASSENIPLLARDEHFETIRSRALPNLKLSTLK